MGLLVRNNMKKIWKILKLILALIVIILAGKFGYDVYQEYQAQKNSEEEVLTVACVGDSNTYHYGGNDVKELNYTYHLKELLGDGYKVRNFGMPGTCVQSDLENPYTDTRAYKASVELEADIIVIMLGTNDIWNPGWRDQETFYQHYITLLDSYLLAENKPEVLLCTIPEVYAEENEILGSDYQEKVVEINAVIKRIASEREYKLIDVYECTSLYPEWYEDDGIHLNKMAANDVAQIIFETIKSK